jgi:hypothetical protein
MNASREESIYALLGVMFEAISKLQIIFCVPFPGVFKHFQ